MASETKTDEQQTVIYQRTMTIMTKPLLARLSQVARKRTMSRSLLIRQACEKLLTEWERQEQETA